jgi:hypothetical protein
MLMDFLNIFLKDLLQTVKEMEEFIWMKVVINFYKRLLVYQFII